MIRPGLWGPFTSTKNSEDTNPSGLLCCETESLDLGADGAFLRTGLTQGGRLLSCSGPSLRPGSKGICVTKAQKLSTSNLFCPPRLDTRHKNNSGLLRQNSSIRSPDLCPQTYLPLKRLKSPTQERRASRAGGMRGWRDSDLQFRRIAINVRPAWVS